VIRLKNKYDGKSAVVVLGGPSILEQNIDLSLINKDKYTVFVESKALTPHFLDSGLEPDFCVMAFPEKWKSNSLQDCVFRSFLAQSNISSLLKPEYDNVVGHMKENFDSYFEPWRAHRGAHKRYRWKPDVYLKESPYELIRELPNAMIIARRDLLAYYFPDFEYPNETYFFEYSSDSEAFDLERYYNPLVQNDKVTLADNSFYNSAAISLYPLLNFMGFGEVFFLGMDMSMLGSMEYAALYTFKSMFHYWWYFVRSSHAFNPNYKANRPFYFRPKSEFNDLHLIWNYEPIRFVRVYNRLKYAAPIKGIPSVSIEHFLANQ